MGNIKKIKQFWERKTESGTLFLCCVPITIALIIWKIYLSPPWSWSFFGTMCVCLFLPMIRAWAWVLYDKIQESRSKNQNSQLF